jgi:hypothetical protein
MKTVLLTVSFFLVCHPAIGAPCTALDYQEMKDMAAEELIQEACLTRQKISENLDDGIQSIGSRRPSGSSTSSTNDFEQCTGQSNRIERVLATKGVEKSSLLGLCEAQQESRKAAANALLKRKP